MGTASMLLKAKLYLIQVIIKKQSTDSHFKSKTKEKDFRKLSMMLGVQQLEVTKSTAMGFC